MEADENGHFTVTVDSSPANGRKNHLQLKPGTGHVVIRDTISDWDADQPAKITVKRTGGPDTAPLEFDQFAARAPQAVLDQAKYALEWYDSDTGFSGPANIAKNTIPRVYLRPSTPEHPGWGMIGVGKYSVADDEALVFTLEVQQADYLGLMITDPWMMSIDFANHTSSLNNLQAWVSAENTITYVVATTDPGVHNWLDTGGIHDGVMLVRWEQMRAEPRIETAVSNVSLIKLADLDAHVPKEMPRVSPQERQTQVEKRESAYNQRKQSLLTSQIPE